MDEVGDNAEVPHVPPIGASCVDLPVDEVGDNAEMPHVPPIGAGRGDSPVDEVGSSAQHLFAMSAGALPPMLDFVAGSEHVSFGADGVADGRVLGA